MYIVSQNRNASLNSDKAISIACGENGEICAFVPDSTSLKEFTLGFYNSKESARSVFYELMKEMGTNKTFFMP